MKTILVVDNSAEIYRDAIVQQFPALSVHTAKSPGVVDIPLDSFHVLVSFGNDLSDDIFEGAKNLEWVQSLATGVDQFLKHPHFRSDTLLTSSRGIHAAPMRETVAHLMFGVSRDVARLVHDKDNRRWDRGKPWPILARKTAVIVGTGVSGIGIAELLQALEMKTIGVTGSVRKITGFDEVVHSSDLAAVAGQADYLINVLPSSKQNKDAISGEVFSNMKPSGIFINVGRGDTVDETALVASLQAGKIAGAGLDVVKERPISPGNPLWDLPNVFISPHIGGFFAEYEEHVMPLLLNNMDAFLAGRQSDMDNIVDH